MNLKKRYREKYGSEHVVTRENSPLRFVEADMLKLAAGETFAFDEAEKEFALIILCGTCAVRGEGFCFDEVGSRKNVFEGVGETVYVGGKTPFTVTATGSDVKICVVKAPAPKVFEPRHIRADEIGTRVFGTGAYRRRVAINLDETLPSNYLYIGEFWVEDGSWASFPPHKHDEDRMPEEGCLEEIYYYEFDRPEGFGVQVVYSADGELDEAYRVTTGDMVAIPKGYHPFTVAPNYKNYCLWIMAGENRGLFGSTEPAHRWMLKK